MIGSTAFLSRKTPQRETFRTGQIKTLNCKNKKIILCKKSNKKGSPVRAACLRNISTRLRGRKKTKRKRTPKKKTRASRTFQQIIRGFFFVFIRGSLQKTIQSRSFRLSPEFILNVALWISETTKSRTRLGPVADDHLCLAVFFFRFRLKKQQHLQTETRELNRHKDEREAERTKKNDGWTLRSVPLDS